MVPLRASHRIPIRNDLAFVGETPTLNNKDEAPECEIEGK